MNMSTINNGATLFEDVTGLEKFSEYEFQVLAFTSDGDGPKSSVKVERTKEDGKRWGHNQLSGLLHGLRYMKIFYNVQCRHITAQFQT